MKIIQKILLVTEEVFPLPFYWLRSRRQMKLAVAGAILGDSHDRYYKLSDEEIGKRLSEERERAKGLDEKTFKMNLALTVGLTILGSTTTLLVKGVPFQHLRVLVAMLAALSIFYSLFGGFLALGAVKTLPSYGYGSDFMIQAKSNRRVMVSALVSQERMNIFRHLRNESAYQCLRNGFLCLFVAVLLYATSVAANTLGPQSPSPGSDHEIGSSTPTETHMVANANVTYPVARPLTSRCN